MLPACCVVHTCVPVYAKGREYVCVCKKEGSMHVRYISVKVYVCGGGRVE